LRQSDDYESLVLDPRACPAAVGPEVALVVLGSNIRPIVRGHGKTLASIVEAATAQLTRQLREAATSSKCRGRQGEGTAEHRATTSYIFPIFVIQ
jgi:hypothetical protein